MAWKKYAVIKVIHLFLILPIMVCGWWYVNFALSIHWAHWRLPSIHTRCIWNVPKVHFTFKNSPGVSEHPALTLFQCDILVMSCKNGICWHCIRQKNNIPTEMVLLRISKYLSRYPHIHAIVYVHIYVYTYIRIYIYIYTYVNIYVY